MTKRLQVLLSEVEFEQLRIRARTDNVSVGEWVRQSIRRSFEDALPPTKDAKIQAVQAALKVYGPSASIEQMNREIQGGYATGLH